MLTGAREHEGHATHIQIRDHPGREAILWTPWKLWVTQTEISQPWDIVMTQPALAAILDQVLRGGEEGVAGVLGGRLFRCPSTKRQWVRVDSIWGSPRSLPDACDAAALSEALAPAPFGEAGSGPVRIGWYHSHSRLGASPTEAESSFHERHFSKPWHFAVILLARSDPAGGIFRSGGAQPLRGSMSLPFYELPSTTRSDGSRQTLVHWQNHTTDNRVHLVDPDSLRDLTPRISAPDNLSGPSMRPQRTRSGAGEPRSARARAWRRRLAGAVGMSVLLLSGWFVWTRLGSGDTRANERSEFASPVSPRAALSESLADFDRAAVTFLALGAGTGIPCDELVPAFQGIESAFLSVTRVYSSLAESIGGSGTVEYEAAGLRLDEIVRQFDASGCNRP
jgi:hypothetical protein